MKDRIKQYMDYKNISAGELATLLDVQRSNISHILNGRNKPGAAFIEKLLLSFPDLNARWLLTGIGDMVEIKRSIAKENETDVQPKAILKKPESLSMKKPEKEEEHQIKPASQPVNRVVLLFGDGTFIDYSKK